MAINELRSISIFVSAAELGSLRKAAAAQGITPQAASQALAQLERRLDVRLFHRTTRVMSLTDEGQAVSGGGPARVVQPSACHGQRYAWPRGNCRPAADCRAAVDVSAGCYGRCWRSSVLNTRASCRTCSWRTASATGWRTAWTWAFGSALSAHEGVIARGLFPVQLVICAAPDTCSGTARRRLWLHCSHTAAACSDIPPPARSSLAT